MTKEDDTIHALREARRRVESSLSQLKQARLLLTDVLDDILPEDAYEPPKRQHSEDTERHYER